MGKVVYKYFEYAKFRKHPTLAPCAGKVVGYAPKVGTAIEDRLGVVKNVCRWDTASRSFIQRQKDSG